jgi:predicted RNA methylase
VAEREGPALLLAATLRRPAAGRSAPRCCASRCPQIDFLLCDAAHVGVLLRFGADAVVTNPPFGTRRKGADMDFLRAAFRLSCHSVYSLHKSSTREHVGRVARRELRARAAEPLAQLRYNLPNTYKFHK